MTSFETLAVHAGADADPVTGAVVPPISLATTFAQRAVGEPYGEFEYGRTGNPTRAALESCLAALEGGRHALAFASGMGAEDAVLRQLRPGDHVLLGDDAYGGTYRLLERVFAPVGITWSPVDLAHIDTLAARPWPDATQVVWVESPTNPALRIADIEAVAALAHSRGARLVVDNTFATPYLQRPLALGADVVVHSSTKYLGGHSDVVGGAVVTDDDELAAGIRFVQNAAGAVPGPFDCYLVLRGVRTLAVRLDRQCANACAVADALAPHPAVDRVLWPGRPEHPGHKVAARQMSDFGAMVSFTVRGGEQAALKVVAATQLFTLAESLGAVESLIEHPARMTHASAAGSALAVDPALIRLSVGIESADDLVADLVQALDAIA